MPKKGKAITRKRHKKRRTQLRKRHTRKAHGGVLSNNTNVSEIITNQIHTTIDKDDPRPGLHLPHHVVSRISGPISMAFLRPKPDKIQEYLTSNIHLPIVLLFGDNHLNASNMCANCICRAGEEKCCFEIYNKTLLHELDTIGRTYPVDYYTEMADLIDVHSIMDTPHDSIFTRFFDNTVKGCHKKELRKNATYREVCPTRFIRWHYGDSRRMYHFIESTLIVYHKLLDSGLIQILDTNPHNPYYGINSVRGGLLKYFISNMKQHIKSDSDIRLIIQCNEQIMRQVLSILFSRTIDRSNLSAYIHNALKEFSTNIVDILIQNKKVSGIYKQLQKMNIKELHDPAYLSSIFHMVYMESPDLLGHIQAVLTTLSPDYLAQLEPIITHILFSYDSMSKEVIDILVNPIYAQQMRHFLATFDNIILSLSAPFLDMYSILRAIKNPTNNIPSVLSVMFMGGSHLRNISNILSRPPFHYNIEYEYGTMNYTYRCAHITSKIPLIQYINEHAEIIKNHDKNHFKIYHNTIKNEWMERKKSASLMPQPPPNVSLSSPDVSGPQPSPNVSLLPVSLLPPGVSGPPPI